MKALLYLTIALAVCSPASAQSQDALNKFHLAQSFEQGGEYERASQLYEDLVRGDSVNYEYFDGLRRCYEQLKEYDKAISLSLRRLSRQPRETSIVALIGSLYYKSGDEARADSAWNAAIAIFPRNSASYTIVSMAQSDNRLFDKSVATYLRGRKEIGEPALFVGELAALYSLTMNYAEATREYLTMLSLNEHELELVESRLAGFTAKEEGLAAATKEVETAVARQSGNIPFQRLLLWLYMEGKRFDKAFDLSEQLEESTHSNGAELFSFADLVFRERSYDVAAKAYRYAIEHYPQMAQLPNAKFGYARAVEELEQPGDTASMHHAASGSLVSETQPGTGGAIELYFSIAKEYPRTDVSVQSLYRAGLMEYKRYFDLDGATEILDSLLMLPNAQRMYPQILGATGEINVAQGKLDKASRRYAGVAASPLSLPEEKMHARYCIAEIQYFQGNCDSASSILQELAKALSDDQSNDALILLHIIRENQAGYNSALKEFARAALLERQKKFSEAIPLLTSIVQEYADAPLVENALIKKAELSVVLGRHNDALASYQKLLSDYPKGILRDKAQFGVGELYQYQFNDKEKAIHAYEDLLATYPNSLLIEKARKRIRDLRGDAL